MLGNLGLMDLREAQWEEFVCERRGGKQMTRKLDGSSMVDRHQCIVANR